MEDRKYTDSFREAIPERTKILDETWDYINEKIISDRIDLIYYKGSTFKMKYSKII